MNPPHVLIVDDDPNVRWVLEKTLRSEGYILDSASSGGEALEKLGNASYDLILLDLYMGETDGLQVLRTVKEKDQELVVIILTAHGSVESAVEGLRQGAFDYMFKPALPDTIRQRVREGLQHREKTLQHRNLFAQIETLRKIIEQFNADSNPSLDQTSSNRFVQAGKLIIDRHHREATFNDKLLDLTSTEFDILLCLVTSAPETISARELVRQVMGYDCEDHEARRIAKWHIHNLRQKIEVNPGSPRYIKTIRYKGYLWAIE